MRGTDWARALAAGTLPGGIAFAIGSMPSVSWWPLALVPLSAWIARPVTGARRGYWWLAIMLGAVSVLAASRGRNLTDAAFGQDAWPSYDLATTPMSTSPPPYVSVTGVLRDGWILGEYAVEQGDVPDQSQPADAVLVPMTGSLDAQIRLRGALVVVRVRADAPRSRDRVTLRGRTEPLPKEIALTLVDLTGTATDDVVGVLVDTLHVASPREAWTALALALGLVAGATLSFGLARRNPGDA